MKLSALQENFSQGLSIVGRGVSSRTTLPVTQNVLLSTENGQLKLTATNLEIAISTWIGAQIEQEGSITVPARLLTEFINSLPQERIDINMQEDPLGLNIECARFEAQINGITAEDFPPIPNVDTGAIGKISSDIFSKAVSHIAFVAATEDSRPVLTGVKVEITGKKFTLAAADGFRLAVYEGKLESTVDVDSLEFTIPAKSMSEVRNLLGNAGGTVQFTVTPNENKALFKIGDVEMFSQLQEGTFPNYNQLIPEKFETRAVIANSELLKSVQTAFAYGRSGSGIVRLRIKNDEGHANVHVSGETEGAVFRAEIPATIEGEDSNIAFSGRYLVEVLQALGDCDVAIETTSSSSPGVVRAVEKSNYVHVVMPMFVQW